MSLFIDKKYINLVSPQLKRFKWKNGTIANVRCPICGDSQKNKTKARGFFFPKKNDYFYKCHNCGVGHSIYRFLERVSPTLASEYAVERWRERGEAGSGSPVEPQEAPCKAPSKSADIRLPKVTDLPEDHVALQYLKNRKIPHLERFYFSNDFGSWVSSMDSKYTSFPNDQRIVIPFFNKRGELIAAQGRCIGGSKNAIRYATAKFVDSDRVVYGEDHIDYSKRVYVVEGPIDSLFLDNSIAMAGCELEQATKMFSDCVIVYDNEPRNSDIVKKMERAIHRGYTVCIWSPSLGEKDINDMVLSGRTPNEVKQMIDECACSGLGAVARFSHWRMR